MSVVLFGVLVVQVVGAALLLLLLVLSRLRQGPRRLVQGATGWVVEVVRGRPVPVRVAAAASRAPPGGWGDIGIGVLPRRPDVPIARIDTSDDRRCHRRGTGSDDPR